MAELIQALPMGHASSKGVHHEPQTTRRLSKAPTSISSINLAHTKAANSPKSPIHHQSQPLDESMFWKSPWTGDLLPKSYHETDLTDRHMVRSFTSFSSSQNESRGSLPGCKRWSSIDDFVLMKQDSSLSRSSSFLSRRLSRRSSMIQRPSFQSQPEGVTVGETRREPVIHFGPSDIGNHDLHSSVETLTSEDISPVEDPRVLLGRRKSFRRPGVATRTPSWGMYRTPLSSIQQEEERPPLPEVSTAQILCEQEDGDDYMPVSSYQGRATSPVALDYSHLSGFKKGTLRIVNTSVSPASTDRVRLFTTCPSQSKSPKSALPQGDSGVFISDNIHQDEAVVIPEDTFHFGEFDISGDGQYLETSKSLASEALGYTRIQKVQSNTNADSGYSSVSSVHSGNSTGLPGSSPSSSSVSSPTRYKAESLADKISYSANSITEPNDGILHDLILSGSSNSGSRQVPRTDSEHARYYAQLSPLCIPSVPETTVIYDKDSDCDKSEGDLSDEQTQTLFSPILPKHAFVQLANELIEKPTQPTIPSHNHSTRKSQDFETPRGRARSRSVGHGRNKLVKSRQVAI